MKNFWMEKFIIMTHIFAIDFIESQDDYDPNNYLRWKLSSFPDINEISKIAMALHMAWNKSKHRKILTLKSISKRNKYFIHHIEVRICNETYYAEMRKKNITSNSIYLICTSTKCNVKVILIAKPEIPIGKVSRYIDRFCATDEMML